MSHTPWQYGTASAAFFALSRSRDAIAAISHNSLRCIPGMTFFRAMAAAPSTPQRTFVVTVALDMIGDSHAHVLTTLSGCGYGNGNFLAQQPHLAVAFNAPYVAALCF